MSRAVIGELRPNDYETCIDCLDIDVSELVLRGPAKAMFAKLMAETLHHPNAFNFFNKWPIIRGFRTAAWDEGDAPFYLGMAGNRIWFGGILKDLEDVQQKKN